MNLDVLNNLINNAKENKFVQNFMKELGEYLEKSIADNLGGVSRNEVSLLDKVREENNVTVEYRDKMYIARRNILQDYARKTAEDGTMYYIYDKFDDNYLVSICDEKRSHEIIELKRNELPEGAGIDSVLRLQNGKYILDNKATDFVREEMADGFDKLLEEQFDLMQERRVDGHVYEFVEGDADSIWLIDCDSNNGLAFEEFEFSKDVFENAKEGDLFEFVNGKYVKYSK